jgi:uncharacterized membrane protein
VVIWSIAHTPLFSFSRYTKEMLVRKTPAEKHRRSVTKSVTYRALSISIDSMVAYFFTHSVILSFWIVLFVNGYSTVLYYIHERVWAHVAWGREKKTDDAAPK